MMEGEITVVFRVSSPDEKYHWTDWLAKDGVLMVRNGTETILWPLDTIDHVHINQEEGERN